MHFNQMRHRPYQGVRVRDPVKELLRRKRSAAASISKTAATSVVGAFIIFSNPSHSVLSPGLFSSEAPAALGEGCSGWRALPWSPPESGAQDLPVQSQSISASSAITSGTDLYMQTLCPSYTMLTYTHTPLLTNFGPIPATPVPTSLPQMDSNCGLTYLPWTAVSSPAALPGSSLIHVPLSMSLATMIPQLDVQVRDDEAQILEQPLHPGTEGQSVHEEAEEKLESPSLLDRLLEEQKADNEDKDSCSNTIFVTNV
uniref:OCA domain-containing protein n=1 Tax=Neogobius melanostomus TaxID=47308 RepID=A0A8C6SYE1_9GOBI